MMRQDARTIADFCADLPRPGVMATVVKVSGSAPQAVGARMWVTPAAFIGTVGGGELERRVLEAARGLLRSGGGARIEELVLCRALGQCCGGRVEIFLEPVGRRRAVHLFGGGHVGRAAAEVLAGMPFDVHVIDPRPDWSSPEGLPRAVRAHQADPLAYAAGRAWGEDDAACVFTHSHELDFSLILRLLREPVGFLGLIGSEHKAKVFSGRLAGLPDGERLRELWEERVRCPIGIPLPSKNPKVIAVSIAAQLLREWGLGAASPVPETAETSAA